MIRIYQTADYEAMSRRAAHIIAAEVYRNPACVLGLATGSTPVGAYKCLSEMVAKGDLSFKEVKSVNLDEYKGLAVSLCQHILHVHKERTVCTEIIVNRLVVSYVHHDPVEHHHLGNL